MSVSALVQFVASGLSTGGIYALVALGFVTIYNVTGVLNLAQGEFAMLGALVMISLTQFYGLHFAVGFVLTLLIVTAVGLLMERLTIHPCRGASPIILIIITLGVDIALRGAALIIWGTRPYDLPPFSAGGGIHILGAVVQRQSVWIVGLSLVIVAALYLFFHRTIQGSALRACAANRQAARLMGISPGTMSLVAFGTAAAIGAVAGIVMAPVTLATYSMGLTLGIKGFVAAILGGLTNPLAAVAGGFILGVLESLGAGYFPSGYKDAVAFVALLAVLLLKPQGLLGGDAAERV